MRFIVFSTLSLAVLLSGATRTADIRREEQFSDRLRKAQREYIQIMGEFDNWCSSHGQRVGAKGAQGDLGCVASSPQAATQTPVPAKP